MNGPVAFFFRTPPSDYSAPRPEYKDKKEEYVNPEMNTEGLSDVKVEEPGARSEGQAEECLPLGASCAGAEVEEVSYKYQIRLTLKIIVMTRLLM